MIFYNIYYIYIIVTYCLAFLIDVIEDTCQKQSKRRKSEKRLQVSEYKKQIGCEKCGYKDNPDILHFHHIDPIYKIGNISRMVQKNHSMDKIYREIQKCRLLCITCHHKEHGIKDNYV